MLVSASALAVAAGTQTAQAAPPAKAALAPDSTLSGTASSIYQTDGTVWATKIGGGVIYAGGAFTHVRPPGSAAGKNQTSRTYLAAFNASTGVVTSFNPTLNGTVYGITLSPDGSTVYIAGTFTTVNGTTRNHFAALTSAGTLTSWNPNATGGNGYSVALGSNGIYVGGTFGKVGGTAHARLAEVSSTTGSLITAFTATADAEVSSMAVTDDGSNRLIVGGNFNTIAGASHHALASLNPTTGADQSWAGDGILPNVPGDGSNPFSGCTSVVDELLYSNGVVYVAGDGAQPGCFDGDFAVTTAGGGTLLWNNACEGATAALVILNGVLYKGSHMHDCAYDPGGPNGGFVGSFDRNNRAAYHLIGQSLTDGSFIHWAPNTNGGAPKYLGPYTMATDGTQLVVGGEFSQVNGVNQQGLTRFQPKSASGNAAPVKPTAAPAAQVTGAGKVAVSVPTTYDYDNGTLTYNLYRGSTLVASSSAVESWPWSGPMVRFNVTVPSTTASYQFRYTATDGTSTTGYSPYSTAVTASTANAPAAYATTVTSANPHLWWRLNNGDTSDSSGNGLAAVLAGGATGDASGAIPGSGSVDLDGSTGYVSSAGADPLSSSFSESVWFEGSALDGGTLLGRSHNQTGTDPAADRAIWLDDDGQLAFAMDAQANGGMPGPPNATIRSSRAYDDGRWHQAVATYDGTTMSLYVDGALVASTTATSNPGSGNYYYRAGYVDISGLSAVFGTNSTANTAPNSYFFDGSIDEVSFYNTALSAAQVSAQYASDAANLS